LIQPAIGEGGGTVLPENEALQKGGNEA